LNLGTGFVEGMEEGTEVLKTHQTG